jgi:hypothetical protein
VIPPAFRDVVLAAMPDTLPGAVEFLVLDPMEDRLQAAQVEFTGRTRRTIPIARPGTSCVGKVKTDPIEVEVLEGVKVLGFERTPVTVLATSPHLELGSDLRCVRLPSAAAAAVAAR